MEQRLNSSIESFLPGLNINFQNHISTASRWILQNLGLLFSGTLSVGFHLFFALFALFYFFRDGKQFINSFKESRLLLPEYAELVIRKLRIAMQSIIGGRIIVATLQGLATGVALFLFGVPSPVLWGTMAALFSFIPMLGTGLVIAPAVLYLFIVGNLIGAIALAFVGVFFIGLIDNFLAPYLIGDKLQIHPLVIFLAILGGIAFFGPEGFILGPLIISLLIVLLEIYRLMMRDKQEAEIKQE
jgi:predicted PurR-regulated permease PerM